MEVLPKKRKDASGRFASYTNTRIAAEKVKQQCRKKAFQAYHLAEEVGFEPTVPQKRTTVFETAPFNRSGTPPQGVGI